MIINIIAAVEASPDLLPYCSSITSRNIDFLNLISYKVPLSAGTAIVSLFVYFINKKAKQFEVSSGAAHLTIRYQRLENIEATKLLAVHTICFLLFYIQNIYVIYLISQSNISELSEFAIAKELSSLTFPIHGNLHVILALSLSKKLRQKFSSCCNVKKIGRIRVSEAETPTRSQNNNADAEREVYFKTYKKQWG